MRFPFLSVVFLFVFLLSPCFFLGAIEMEFSAGVNNMDIHKVSGTNSIKHFPFVFGNFSMKGDIVKNLGLKAAFSRDPFMQNTLSGMITADSDYLNVEFGPFIGIIDDTAKLDFGVTGKIQLAYPGIAFFTFSGDASLGSQYDFLDRSDRERAEFTIGFWLPNFIPSFTFISKNYTSYINNSIAKYELLRLHGSADFFWKTFPITFRIDVGYQKHDFSSQDEGNTELSGELSCVFAGLEVKWRVAPQLRIITGFETPIVFTTQGDEEKPEGNFDFNLYKFNVGAVINF